MMTISLPDIARADLESRAATANLSVEEFVLRAAYAVSPEAIKDVSIDDTIRRWLAGGERAPSAVTTDEIEARKLELEAALLVGLSSGPSEAISAKFWEERRRVLSEIHSVRDGGQP